MKKALIFLVVVIIAVFKKAVKSDNPFLSTMLYL
jgi:hypothetical protein